MEKTRFSGVNFYDESDVTHRSTEGLHPYKNSAANKTEKRIQFIKYLMFVFNLLFFILGCIVVGVGIWVAVDRGFIAVISNFPMIEVAAYMFAVAGFIIMIIAFFGCCGSVNDNKSLLSIYLGVLIFIFLVLFISAILAIVFRSQLGSAIRDTMKDTLRDRYGVDQHEEFNRAVTHAWDKAQERLWCCGVDSNGWGIYRESKWFEEFGAIDGIDGQIQGSEDQKPYVPRSCCVHDRFYRYIDRWTCQKWRLGPPAQSDGAINRALYYQGCYNAGKDYVLENSNIIMGFSFFLIICMVTGIVGSVLLLKHLRNQGH